MPASLQAICRGLAEQSALLRHELAYVLGQLQDPLALPKLSAILDDEAEDAMVRHEAAEAIGAIGLEESLPILRKYENTPITGAPPPRWAPEKRTAHSSTFFSGRRDVSDRR